MTAIKYGVKINDFKLIPEKSRDFLEKREANWILDGKHDKKE
jgi:hypothetical protein